MPFDHNGQLVEAADCASCNSSLEWHGRLPEDPADVLCNDCARERAEARAEKAEAEVARLRVIAELAYTAVIEDHESEDGRMSEDTWVALSDACEAWQRSTSAKNTE